MKKLLAGLIAGSMALSCMAGYTSVVFANETENVSEETADAETSTGMNVKLTAPEDDLEMYLSARNICQHLAAYEPESIGNMGLEPLFLNLENTGRTLAENIELIENEDEEMQAKLDTLREAYNQVIQIHEYDEVNFDIWEGHDELPLPGEIAENNVNNVAALTDDEGFRPFINCWMQDDPAAAKGTLICVPSIRASVGEELHYATYFGEMGYNVIGVEPRMTTIEGTKGWLLVTLDAQRAVRYIKYHADDLGIDPEKLILVAGSKGNTVHNMTSVYFDQMPEKYCEDQGVILDNYEDDEIDQVLANVAVSIISYGNMYMLNEEEEIPDLVFDDAGLYSQEYFEQGLKLPAYIVLSGNLDGFCMPRMANCCQAFVDFNAQEDKLYPINWEMHIFDGVTHGFGAGLQYNTLPEQWKEIDAFIQNMLAAE